LVVAKTDFNYENYSNTPDEYIWVNGANAIGFGSKKHYQIVDEFGQPLNLLEDKVETRITTISASGIDVLDIQVLFNLIVIDE